MSDCKYSSRLWWNGTRGGLRCGCVTVDLDRPPAVLPQIQEVDFGELEVGLLAYAPEIRLGSDARREMYEPEIEAVRNWLHAIEADVLGGLQRSFRARQ